jgi:hypothetical protein
MPNELATCEIYNPVYHGILEPENKYIYTSLLYLNEVSLGDLYSDGYDVREYNAVRYNGVGNPYVRDTLAINSHHIHIVERVQYNDYTLCIIKTHWLKIIQRIWKRWYHGTLSKRKNIINLMNRSMYGRWIY